MNENGFPPAKRRPFFIRSKKKRKKRKTLGNVSETNATENTENSDETSYQFPIRCNISWKSFTFDENVTFTFQTCDVHTSLHCQQQSTQHADSNRNFRIFRWAFPTISTMHTKVCASLVHTIEIISPRMSKQSERIPWHSKISANDMERSLRNL